MKVELIDLHLLLVRERANNPFFLSVCINLKALYIYRTNYSNNTFYQTLFITTINEQDYQQNGPDHQHHPFHHRETAEPAQEGSGRRAIGSSTHVEHH